MPRPAKGEASNRKRKSKPKQLTEEEKEAIECSDLISIIRHSEDKKKADVAFEDIVNRLKSRIQKIVNRFNINGFDSFDIMQEALYALRYKAIKDYNPERGNGIGWAPFERFAMLCIRRHLSTEYKSSHQNKKKVLNSSISLNQDTSNSSEDDLSLANIISNGEDSILEQVEASEYYRDLMLRLMQSLSAFEKEVFLLYAQSYTYEEIADKINENRVKIKVKVKGVDNALSRIKNKARHILVQYELAQEDEDEE